MRLRTFTKVGELLWYYCYPNYGSEGMGFQAGGVGRYVHFSSYKNFPGGSDGKASAYNSGDPGSIPGLGKSSAEGNGNPLQHSCLENPMDGEA